MTESQLTADLIKYLRQRLSGAVIFKHADKVTTGIPDFSITWEGITWWWEVKKEENWPPTKLQVHTIQSLDKASGGKAGYLIFQKVKTKTRMIFLRGHHDPISPEVLTLMRKLPFDKLTTDYDAFIWVLKGGFGAR